MGHYSLCLLLHLWPGHQINGPLFGKHVKCIAQWFILHAFPLSCRQLVGATGIVCCTDDFFVVDGQ